MVSPDFPDFPSDVPTHPLLVIDYELLEQRNASEIDRLWEAATQIGFWYLKNHGVNEYVDRMFDLGMEVMKLPLEEKMKFEQGDDGISFGYKAAGANAVDASGKLDTVEFLNVAKDDALSYPTVSRRSYPPAANQQMLSTIQPFVVKSLEVTETILDIFNERLGLPTDRLSELHPREEWSGSESRIIKNPPPKEVVEGTKQAIGSHTDFGSLSFLHNRLGGLQVLPPGYDEWQYVKPISRHAVCNIGDALSILSGGILRSNLHRVVPPPGEQRAFERWSLVYFMRPANSVILRPLAEESHIISNRIELDGEEAKRKLDTGVTAKEWFERRIRNQRIKNRKGPETWIASRGTERIEA